MRLFKPNIQKMHEKEDVVGLIKALSDKDLDVCHAAARSLGEIGDTQAVKPLLTLLGHSEWPIRKTAAEVLGLIKNELAVEPLVASLKYDHEWVREAIIEALGQIGTAEAVEALLSTAITDENHSICKSALETLGQMDESGTEALITAISESTSCHHATYVLSQMGGRMSNATLCTRVAEAFISVLKEPDQINTSTASYAFEGLAEVSLQEKADPAIKAWQAVAKAKRVISKKEWKQIASMGTVAIEPLIIALHKENNAIDALVEIGVPVIESLISALRNAQSIYIRGGAAKALGMIGDLRAVEPLILALIDNDRYVIIQAAWALGEINDGRAVAPLANLLKAFLQSNKRGDVVESVFYALQKLGNSQAMDVFIAALAYHNSTIRCDAAEELGRIGDAKAVSSLTYALRDKKWAVREAAANALVSLYRSGKLDEQQKQSVLAHRDIICSRHIDDVRGCGDHRDKGIGVTF